MEEDRFLDGFPHFWCLKEKNGEKWLKFVPQPKQAALPAKAEPTDQTAGQEPKKTLAVSHRVDFG